MVIMVSACLLGTNCKYSGGNNYSEAVAKYVKGHRVIPVCPEVMGGLPTPRTPVELRQGVAIMKDGTNVDAQFRLGAEKALAIARELQPDVVILQSRSPSCGSRQIYDGTFSGVKIPGRGIFAGLLLDAGFRVLDAEEL